MGSRRRFAVLALVAPLLLLAACGTTPTGSDPGAPDGKTGNPTDETGKAAGSGMGVVELSLDVGHIGMLAKGSAITLKTLVLTAVHGGSKPDTVRDTSIIGGGQPLKRALKLGADTNWVLYGKTLDARDSLIHQGVTARFAVKLSDTVRVPLELRSRFSSYAATFVRLPVSVGLGDGSGLRMGVALTRLVLTIDGVARVDTVAKDWFSPEKPLVLGFDYVPVGRHDIVIDAYGQAGDFKGRLYSGMASVTSVAGEDGGNPIALAWVGPSAGTAQVEVILGRVGKVELRPDFPDTIGP